MIFRRSWLSAAVLALAVSSLPSVAAAAAPRPSGTEWSVQRDTDALRDTGVTGAAVRLETPRGTVTARSGVGDLVTGRPVPKDGFLRLGSTTKTFVATVMMQLVGEERVSLDQTVEQLLPGVVSGAGNDGRTITVRDLLQHTSGLPDYIYDVFPDPGTQTYFANRWRTYRPEELVDLAMRHEPAFPAGTRWAYSNTNYVLAGMIIENITGRTWEQQVHSRILRPLGLQHTDTPGTRPFLPYPHTANHQQFTVDEPMVDTTIPYRPFDSGADGSMTGTARDLNRFFAALARGQLLKPAELAAMQSTVPMPQDSGHPEGTRDGLGLFSTPLSCGGGYLGHGGSGFGYVIRAATTVDGRRTITVSAHSRSADPQTAARQEDALRDLIDHALCRTT
ncbi:beta-lactamase family protein [Streptomyces sp. NBC_00053]|uniref:serine hydrolase domain-containing protein n=1 Tax=Streptomyces sp. ADI95-17 TaxID=1522759 RepID=UPI0019CFFF5F|nr:serine hydrolase domain-containing protein [Streptomyces sp. ADI95-17]MCX4399232.1 beta-lactamase family protein [Streptomyces sp. NBC_01767]MCX5098352.1 beta-lactamase family protein [Streptomyces sp. NBC_00439]MCX5157773.1 beta-lactamase family protein [Streptomyces sp. NBC_00305]MCX5216296.1 beta-lactamase family protein [Streptomyces sp. NBC_00264]MCX5498209.1 beta-lactamase family protein [Streptomyces sp. NBC_00052]MCX5553259.1 beta-lactamase family protein [Streptomyces sp. NBC_0005